MSEPVVKDARPGSAAPVATRGTVLPSGTDAMIRHIVLTKFKAETDNATIADIYAALSALTRTITGAHGFTGGRSRSPEQIERGYTHAFVIDFDTWADLKTYAEHPAHRALGARIVENAVGGMDGVLVLDLEILD